MNSHQRRKRRRFWERAVIRANALLKQHYASQMQALIPRRDLLLYGVDHSMEGA